VPDFMGFFDDQTVIDQLFKLSEWCENILDFASFSQKKGYCPRDTTRISATWAVGEAHVKALQNEWN
jgi:hypothetical protein